MSEQPSTPQPTPTCPDCCGNIFIVPDQGRRYIGDGETHVEDTTICICRDCGFKAEWRYFKKVGAEMEDI